ncbi:hypothetical protein [Desulfococcus sp.]|uniref:hypothetical protein n=1 Tax=Desulfococcus sp. TaxID=2025834 RepID=UPI0035936939
MKITCDKCDTQIELGEDPGQLKTSTICCTHCNAILDVVIPTVEKNVDTPAKAGSDMPSPKTAKEKRDFLRTDMPGKKRKKKNVSESVKANPPHHSDGKKKHSDPAGAAPDRMDPIQPKTVSGGLLDTDDPFDFLADEEEKSGAGDMFNEKTEVLGIDDIDFNTGNDASAGGSSRTPGGGPATDGNLFLDFDLEGLGLDADAIRRIDGAEDTDALDGMEPFTLDLDEEFSAVSDDETIVLDLDLDGRSERFRPASEKRPVDAVSKAAAPGAGAGSFSEEPAPASAEMDGRFGAAGKDGLLDLFLDMDHRQKSGVFRSKQFPEDVGLMQIEDDDFFVDGEDPENLPLDIQSLKKELDARGGLNNQEDFLEFDLGADDDGGATPSEDVGLGLDENLLLDLDFDFDVDEHRPAAAAEGSRAEAVAPAPGGAPRDAVLETDENLFLDLDLDLDFEEDEERPATVAMAHGAPLLKRDPVMETVPDDEGLLEDLDLDLEEDEHGLATVVADGGLNRDPDPMAASEDVELVLDDDDLLLDLDLGEDRAAAAEEDAAAEDDSVALVFDLDEESPQEMAAPAALRDEEFSLELDLDLDDGAEEAPLPDRDGGVPEFDLDLSPGPVADAAAPAGGRDEEFSLELDLETELESISEAGKAASDEQEDFSLELDQEESGEDAAVSEKADDAPRRDLEKAPVAEKKVSLELERDDAGAGHADARASEVDEMLKAIDGDSESDEEFLFNMELERFEEAPDALETEPAAVHAGVAGGSDPDVKSTFQDEPESFEVVEEILLSSDRDLRAQEMGHRDEDFIDAFDMGIPTNEFEELNENPPEDKKPQKVAAHAENRGSLIAAGEPGGRRRIGLSVLILVLALIGALLFGAYSFGLFEGFNARNILHNIPFLKEHVAAPNHAGEIVALENTIKNRFVENKVVGTLFVITGKVRNDFPSPQSHIEVVGRLFSPGKKAAGKESVYCGNNLTDQELTTLPSDRIKDLLRNKAGKNSSNVNVPSGKVLSYMIVFDHLPGTLEAFDVAVKGSVPSGG